MSEPRKCCEDSGWCVFAQLRPIGGLGACCYRRCFLSQRYHTLVRPDDVCDCDEERRERLLRELGAKFVLGEKGFLWVFSECCTVPYLQAVSVERLLISPSGVEAQWWTTDGRHLTGPVYRTREEAEKAREGQ